MGRHLRELLTNSTAPARVAPEPAKDRVSVMPFPVGVDFADLYPAVARRRLPFILDSSLTDGRLGRWSFVGFDPRVVLICRGGKASFIEGDIPHQRQLHPFSALRSLINRWLLISPPGAPPFIGGAVGYLAYDLKNHLERLPDTVHHDIPLPEMVFAVYESVLAFEHATGECLLVVSDLRGLSRRGRLIHRATWRKRWEGIAEEARTFVPPSDGAGRASPAGTLVSNFTRSAYLAAVRRTIDYIARGDIFQANLSQRFAAPYRGDPFALYLRLRRTNPSPFGAYLSYPFGAVLSSSPERFLKVVGRHVQTRPIKGTRPRLSDPEADRRIQTELLQSPKDNAELTMIVDLERNDLGRVCHYGTVRVTERRVLETYARVHHLVATVEGDLHERYDLVDLLKATFPGGSITGAPKIRAMEIIDELEPTARSVYTGAIGYIGLNGNMDLNIAIRTALVVGGTVYVQVGGGIVADSDPEAEFEETLHKGRAIFAALGAEGESR